MVSCIHLSDREKKNSPLNFPHPIHTLPSLTRARPSQPKHSQPKSHQKFAFAAPRRSSSLFPWSKIQLLRRTVPAGRASRRSNPYYVRRHPPKSSSAPDWATDQQQHLHWHHTNRRQPRSVPHRMPGDLLFIRSWRFRFLLGSGCRSSSYVGMEIPQIIFARSFFHRVHCTVSGAGGTTLAVLRCYLPPIHVIRIQ